MGASGWQYVVPYDPRVRAVVLELQQKVFDEHDYYWPDQEHGWPATMRELFAQESFKESGTHSILDIIEVIRPDAPDEWGTLRHLDAEETARFFGTPTPSVAEFESGVARLRQSGSPGGRWGGYAVELYEDGVRSHFGIWGISGD
ncbi:hypothetical protein BJY16_005900 [Actinoplanes octamycinicus]|uniref:Uncharacterized protein n=1 Tax=Actinoplanes octamycinicus TaxID=135948 RepID=A0A7W7MA10_9ACTN|nr:hypothetical protein [Actinoplanes octamycinicus]MBB4742441.1 hypothetical protein [Actinoplanes octamycinicus]GIE62309.1 hypothetical protein Aoc01nite_77110 [Actinoplanes octamycinicus]